MRSYMVYEAEDGEIFESEEECRAHEYRMNHLPPAIVWFDRDWDELVPETSKQVEDYYQLTEYMEILDQEGWEKDLEFLQDNWGFGERDMVPGFYKYIGNCSSIELEAYQERHFKIYGWNEWIRLAKKGGPDD